MTRRHHVTVGPVVFGEDTFAVIAGPAAIESERMMFETARVVADAGAHVLQGGAFLHQDSPYDFQGLELEGLRLLRAAADSSRLPTMSGISSPRDIQFLAEFADIIQVPQQLSEDYSLLSELSKMKQAVLLTRGLAAKISEFLAVADNVASPGNVATILCDTGIRTFEMPSTPCLDLHGIAKLVIESPYPVLVDLTHCSSKLVPSMARSAVAVGADGVVIALHPTPSKAITGSQSSLNPREFNQLMKHLTPYIDLWREAAVRRMLSGDIPEPQKPTSA